MTTATKAGGAVLPVVAWLRKNSSGEEITVSDSNLRTYQPKSVQDAWGTCPTLQALTTHAPAQATIDELRAEVERLTRENVALKDGQQIDARNYLECDAERERLTRELVAAMAEHDDIRKEYAALKAKQIDVEAVMRLADAMADAAYNEACETDFGSGLPAARKALRASLLGDGGTAAMASQEKPHD